LPSTRLFALSKMKMKALSFSHVRIFSQGFSQAIDTIGNVAKSTESLAIATKVRGWISVATGASCFLCLLASALDVAANGEGLVWGQAGSVHDKTRFASNIRVGGSGQESRLGEG
jgi:hypothetical protein